ncbi:MAG: DUF6048 family protein [Cyclobacteriaceae bacterium]
MLSTTKYIFSIGLLLISLLVSGQDEKPKTEEKVKPPRKDFKPTGIRVGTDLLDLVKTGATKTFKGWELNGDIDFANYYLTADIGSWAKDLDLNNGHYSNNGNYFRLGVDINLLGKDPDKNMFFFGFRVGRSFFNESLQYNATSSSASVPYSIFPSTSYNLTNNGARGGWAELTTGLRVKVWKGLWMGYTARMKFAPSTKGGSGQISPYDMPGYGIVSKTPWWGFNYQVFWRFAWKKDKPLPKK